MSQGRAADAEIQGFFCPLQPPRLLAKRLASGKCAMTEVGLEKLCARCGNYWPMDTEFWFLSKTNDGLFGWCRSCYIAHRWPGRGELEATGPAFAFTELLAAAAPTQAVEVPA